MTMKSTVLDIPKSERIVIFRLKMNCYFSRKTFLFFKTFLPFFIFLNTSNAFSQDAQALMMEPEFTVLLSTESQWSYSFGLANRGILIDEIEADNYSENVTEHLEVNSWVIYRTGENSDVSLGIRYRFREIFEPNNENLFRILQQYFSEHSNPFIGWWHRTRFEQRFGPDLTSFRLRYEFGLSKPLNEDFSLELSTEALYRMSKEFKPQPEQRVALGVVNTSFEKWDFNLGLEYRMDNYIRNQENNFFILADGKLKL